MGHATEPMAVDARLMEANPTIPCHHSAAHQVFQTVDRGPFMREILLCMRCGGFAPSTNQTGAEFSLHIVPLCIANPGFVLRRFKLRLPLEGPRQSATTPRLTASLPSAGTHLDIRSGRTGVPRKGSLGSMSGRSYLARAVPCKIHSSWLP